LKEDNNENMALRFYNTLTGKDEEFVPLIPGTARVYVCGVTVYDRSHIGHARALVAFDVIYRYLQFSGYDVTFVRNFTDVDDKIINRANERGISAQELTETYIEEFNTDMQALRCLPPTHEPRATQHIPDMIALIQELEAQELAYSVDGDVYYAVDRFADYGKLAHRCLEDMSAGARVQVDERKRHPMDFALWKSSKPGEPAWPSPWGEGRPGWHIECSAMSSKYLGQPFDIHGGGADLIFPHHENEIAQSEGAKSCALARYWLHNGMVTVEQEKMSKSLGNFLTIGEALAKVSTPEVLRQVLLSSHYRMALDFSTQKMEEAEKGLVRIYGTLDGVREMNRELDAGEIQTAAILRYGIATIGNVIGLLEESPAQYLDNQKQSGLEEASLTPEAIEGLIAERAAARKDKNFQRADKIRDQLSDQGIILKDSPTGTTWTVK